ncbi:site-specific DNA-methyltransferase [Methanohalophilus sp.]
MAVDYETKLKSLLRTLFQFESADLDFGIYRIMNKKRDDINKFIDEDLIEAIHSEFESSKEADQKNIEEDLKSIESEMEEKFGSKIVDDKGKLLPVYAQIPLAQELAEKYNSLKTSIETASVSDQHKADIFSHIYHFFSRYYDNGDFVSLRRYSHKEKYAIPYNGEEVLLHWANKDQYYIKTGEYFKNYSFKTGEYTVNFELVEAENTTNNNKSEKRYFVLGSTDENPTYDAENKELTIFFEYRELIQDEQKEYGTRNAQDNILETIYSALISNIQNEGLKQSLTKKYSEKRTLLQKHLYSYTKRNTTDYFIHKDLKGFLTQELDFYIKNEVFNLDDLGTDNEVTIEQYVTRARVIKSLCLKIIDFLAQIEDFQKMLFEKKKFVVQTDYCMTLDNVPEELYPEISENEDQINEWKKLYGFGENKQSTLFSFDENGNLNLRENPYLVLDTKFFNQDIKDRLIASFDNLDELIDGILAKSENLQMLNLLHNKYAGKIKCTYIDPPYNTEKDKTEGKFVYKDGYDFSSWLTFMYDRLHSSWNLICSRGGCYISIDDVEYSQLYELLANIYGRQNHVATVIWEKVHTRKNSAKYFSVSHDYIPCFAKNKDNWERILIPRDNTDAYKNPDNDPKGPWKSDPVYANNPYDADYTIEKPNGIVLNRPPGQYWRFSEDTIKSKISKGEIIWGKGKSYPMIKRYLSEVQNGLVPVTLYDRKFAGDNPSANREFDELFGSDRLFSYPKPTKLIMRLLQTNLARSQYEIALDFFAGSGTTGNAVINLNREDGGNRKYILVEMGEYFDTVMKPRIQKVMYSDNWKNGKPQSNDGIRHIFKYQSLEQYEDSLNNIEFSDSGSFQRTLSDMDGYFLRYMLDFETKESPCRMNIAKLKAPFDYKMKIAEGNEIKEKTIDLVETFNYLLGIHVLKIQPFENDGIYYRVILGQLEDEKVLIIWRNTENLDLGRDKDFIEGTIIDQFKPSKTYINADFHVKNAYPIEPEFKQLMGA